MCQTTFFDPLSLPVQKNTPLQYSLFLSTLHTKWETEVDCGVYEMNAPLWTLPFSLNRPTFPGATFSILPFHADFAFRLTPTEGAVVQGLAHGLQIEGSRKRQWGFTTDDRNHVILPSQCTMFHMQGRDYCHQSTFCKLHTILEAPPSSSGPQKVEIILKNKVHATTKVHVPHSTLPSIITSLHFTELGKPLLQNSWLSIGSSLPTS